MSCIRVQNENAEKLILGQNASLSVNTRGRKTNEKQCEFRTDYQRDRDRIIHSKAFRRLKHKTQVFLSPESSHYRTRLTHTLEVSQIARTIARALKLNEDLTEAIALGHDLGHTPFGHAGERALDSLSSSGFTHYEQSVRVCERLEKGGRGLNLTYEVLDGIKHHTKGEWAATLEGRVVRVADRVAYINHDIDDAVRGGVISENDIPVDVVKHLGKNKSERINSLVKSIIENSTDDIIMDEETKVYYDKLYNYLFDSVYINSIAKSEESKVFGFVEALYKYFLNNTHKLTEEYRIIAEQDGKERAVMDYIAGMTDDFAVKTYSDIFVPKSWTI